MDTAGTPHVVFCGFGPAQGLHYLKKTGGGWADSLVDPAECGAHIPSLAVDGSGVPHIAYDRLADHSLRYAVLSGTTWLSVTIDVSSEGPSLALDGHGNPSVAYTHDGPRVDYAVLSGTTWLTQTVGEIGAGKSLALDGLDRPHIAYCGFGPHAGMNYVFMTAGGWQRETGQGS